jgi:diguanylate cyclase (GGDEF)-like protein/PAS domain S-box-containing protein
MSILPGMTKPLVALYAVALTLVVMTVYEVVELLVGRALSSWHGHVAVVALAAVVNTVVALMVFRRERRLEERTEAAFRQQLDAEESLLSGEQHLLHDIYDHAPIGIAFFDRKGCLLDMNDACMHVLGVADPDEQLGRSLFELPYLSDDLKRRIDRGETITGELAQLDFDDLAAQGLVVTRHGQVSLELTVTPLAGGADARIGYLVHMQDVTERERRGHEIEHLAFHDPVTDLPNRKLLDDHARVSLAQARRHGYRMAMLFIDVDDFKTVNDRHGHDVGDELLRQAGGRLVACLREGDTVARVGGDEFMMLLAQVDGVTDATLVARRIAAALRPPFDLGAATIAATVSTGIALYPDDADDLVGLQGAADRAMYQVKAAGKDGYGLAGGASRRAGPA